MDEPDDSRNRQAQLQSDITACQEDRSAALRFDETTTPTIIGSGEEARSNALIRHLLRIGRGVHIAETDNRFHTDIVNRAGDHEVSLAEFDLIHAFFQ